MNKDIMSKEVHLFIIWEKAQYKRKEILDDIGTWSEIIDVINVQWSQEEFSRNMSRFYGQKLPKGSHKEKHVGRGIFTIVIIKDTPKYEKRKTSRGYDEVVNINMFDSKQKYRKWTGGGHKIHATDSITETIHNVMLLLDSTYESYAEKDKWNGIERNINKDLAGAKGWKDLNEVFKVLNATSNYIVLRNFEVFPDDFTMEEHGDIDFLSEKPIDFAYILNGYKVFNRSYRMHYRMNVGGSEVLFDSRGIDDNYYDKQWSANILASKIIEKDLFYRPTQSQYFYSLLYHALVHKVKISDDYISRLNELAAADENLNKVKGKEDMKSMLLSYMKSNNYSLVIPKDNSVYFNGELFDKEIKLPFRRLLEVKKMQLRLSLKNKLK